MATVNNIAGNTTGSANNGRACVWVGKSAAAAGVAGRIQTINSPGFTNFTITDFDTNNFGPVLDDRFDDPRYYEGDAVT